MENKQTSMKLFLDDIRDPIQCSTYMHTRIGALNPIYAQEWTIVRNYDQFVKAINDHYNQISHISYDHDLAEAHYHESMYHGNTVYTKYLETISEKTGYDCAKYMKEFYDERQLEYPIMFVHSMNPVGTENIINLFNPIKHGLPKQENRS